MPKIEGVLSNISISSLKLNNSLSLAQTKADFEGYERQAWDIQVRQDLYHNYKFSKKIILENQLFFRGNWYESNRYWHDYFLLHHLRLRRLKSKDKLFKEIFNKGSPFLYEQYEALTNDEIGAYIHQKIMKFEFFLDSYYTVKNKELRKLDVTFLWNFHCWDLGLVWKTKSETINVTGKILIK